MVDRLVDTRLDRQKRLTSGNLTLWAILDESLLHRAIGGSAVLKAQLDHLLTPPGDVTIQVVRHQAIWHAGLNGAFAIMKFDHYPTVAFVESLTGDLEVEEEKAVYLYTQAFDYVRATAAGVEESRAMIVQARNMIG